MLFFYWRVLKKNSFFAFFFFVRAEPRWHLRCGDSWGSDKNPSHQRANLQVFLQRHQHHPQRRWSCRSRLCTSGDYQFLFAIQTKWFVKKTKNKQIHAVKAFVWFAFVWLQCAILSPAFKVREFSITDVVPFPITLRWKSTTEDGMGLVYLNKDILIV